MPCNDRSLRPTARDRGLQHRGRGSTSGSTVLGADRWSPSSRASSIHVLDLGGPPVPQPVRAVRRPGPGPRGLVHVASRSASVTAVSSPGSSRIRSSGSQSAASWSVEHPIGRVRTWNVTRGHRRTVAAARSAGRAVPARAVCSSTDGRPASALDDREPAHPAGLRRIDTRGPTRTTSRAPPDPRPLSILALTSAVGDAATPVDS